MWCPGCGGQPCFEWPPPVMHCGGAEYDGGVDCGWRMTIDVEPGNDLVLVGVANWEPK